MPNPEVERHCQGGGAAALDALEEGNQFRTYHRDGWGNA